LTLKILVLAQRVRRYSIFEYQQGVKPLKFFKRVLWTKEE
jgi:hypothetical protein